jgi:hypothetical protein
MRVNELIERAKDLGIEICESRLRELAGTDAGLIEPPSDSGTPDENWQEQSLLDLAAIDFLYVRHTFGLDAVRIARVWMLAAFQEGSNLMEALTHVREIAPENYLACSLWVLAVGKATLGIPTSEPCGIETWAEAGGETVPVEVDVCSEDVARAYAKYGAKVGEVVTVPGLKIKQCFRAVDANQQASYTHPSPVEFVRGKTNAAALSEPERGEPEMESVVIEGKSYRVAEHVATNLKCGNCGKTRTVELVVLEKTGPTSWAVCKSCAHTSPLPDDPKKWPKGILG